MNDAVAYMAWKRIVPWKILSMKAHPDEKPVPIGFGARTNSFQDLLEPGSQIWVVTRIAKEFSLAGRVTVKEILDRNSFPPEEQPEDLKGLFVKWRFVARADLSNSEFFETNNAEPVLAKYQIQFAQNRSIVFHNTSLEESFNECIEQARKVVFLSYRWDEARRFAIAIARNIRKKGLSPWLDALSVPAYKLSPGFDENADFPRLKRLIELGIEKSQFAVVINTRTFAKTDWTRIELEHILKTEIPWFQIIRGGDQLKCREAPIFKRKPDLAVQEILKQHALPF